MTPISDKDLGTLLVELHAQIVQSAISTVAALNDPQISYPPNGSLTSDERNALASLSLSIAGASALRKLLADSTTSAIFNWFCVIDAVADPLRNHEEPWLGVRFGNMEDDNGSSMLHDMFYSTWWDFTNAENVV